MRGNQADIRAQLTAFGVKLNGREERGLLTFTFRGHRVIAYSAIMRNFVHPTDDASEAPWKLFVPFTEGTELRFHTLARLDCYVDGLYSDRELARWVYPARVR